MKDALKVAVMLVAYFGVGPLLGMMIAGSRKAQRVVFSIMMVMPCLPPGKLTLMVDSWELYRGHTKGFEANWIEVLGIGIIFASWKNRAAISRWRLLPPGTLLFLAWVAASLLSLLAAGDKVFALMAAFKFGKAVIIFMAAAHFLRDETDLFWLMRSLAGTQMFYALLCLKMRYVDGMFQIKGWFEHQNPMAMWCYMGAVPMLSLALSRRVSTRDFVIFIGGFCGAVLCVLLSVSRAGLGALGAGAVAVVALGWLRAPGKRVAAITAGGIIGAMLVSAFAMNSFRARFNEVAETSQQSELDLRDVLNMQSREMLHDSSIGIGWNNFGVMNSRPLGDKYSAILEEWDASRGFRVYDENYFANPLTESLYWLFLAETGYPGFITFLCFALATLWFAARAALRHWRRPMGGFAAGVFFALGICYMHGTVERILTQTKNLSFWLILCGLVSALQMMAKQQAAKE